ncbi:TonB-dependent siderophore receptor [Pseudomonas aegrilactucae]|uniref:TonB-dependent siderophore receptor n=1 Tax=Pseudomonas aegrilactucae TaxID=2854028 RepID=A0A9Q2XE64_9PSED|nr:TonB-dependent siderophore receptor [Pseudomonas aegrilactucae]MBV6285758.1 TonB-dependent siderophore receptor [Pseudomonas aegrilactucae]
MPCPFETLLRRCLLALTLAGSTASAAGQHNYNLPTGPLATTLNQIASQAGIALTLDPRLANGLHSAPVTGQYDGVGALQAALRGTGLQLQQSSAGTYSLAAAPEGRLALPVTSINAADTQESAWGPATGFIATRTAAGSKTDTPIVEAPRSLSVITRQQLDQRQVLNLNDALRYTVGVQSSGYGADSRADWLRVRSFDPTQFLDGLALPKGSFANPKVEPWNLERITVLRGPASSVYGQTPPGGMLDLLSRRPQADRAHQLQAQLGSNEHRQINVDSTGKVDPAGQFLYRVSGVVRDSHAPVEHIPDKRYNLAPSLTWNLADDTRLTFISQFTRDDTGITGQFLPLQGTRLSSPAGATISHHKNLGEPDWDFYDRTYYALGYAFEHRLDEVWQFRQNLRYTKSDLGFQAVNVGTVNVVETDGMVNRESGIINEDISQFALDNNLQADFSTGAFSHTLLLGLDHQRSNTRYQWLYGGSYTFDANGNITGINVPPISVIDPVYGADLSSVSYTALQDYGQTTRQTGLYVQDQIAWDNWRLTLGGREDWIHTATTFHNRQDVTSTLRDKAFTGNLGLSYVFDNGLTPYLSWTESFQPTTGASVNAAQSFKPTRGRQYEAGVKYQPLGSNTLLTAAAYDLRQGNVKVTEGSINRQVGELQVRGVELEATTAVSDNLALIAAYTYTDTQISKGLPAEVGNRMALIPRRQATLWADYTWHAGALDGVGVGAGVRHVGDTYGNTTNTEVAHTGAYTVYDAVVRYDLGRLDASLQGLSVAVEAKNLFNKDYLANCDGFWCYYGDQRNVVASVNYRF